jgi:hypothetical protein
VSSLSSVGVIAAFDKIINAKLCARLTHARAAYYLEAFAQNDAAAARCSDFGRTHFFFSPFLT